jgi:hypothetical protein
MGGGPELLSAAEMITAGRGKAVGQGASGNWSPPAGRAPGPARASAQVIHTHARSSCVGQRGLPDVIVPLGWWELARDDRERLPSWSSRISSRSRRSWSCRASRGATIGTVSIVLATAISKSAVQGGRRASSRLEVEHPELHVVLDEATRDMSGSPDIPSTILAKIREADAFVADITTIPDPAAAKPCPNPNVLIELGYAVSQAGWPRIVLLFNEAHGNFAADVPWDIQSAGLRFESLRCSPMTALRHRGSPESGASRAARSRGAT